MSLQWPAWLTQLAWLAFYTHSTILSIYADDTQMFYAENNVKTEQAGTPPRLLGQNLY